MSRFKLIPRSKVEQLSDQIGTKSTDTAEDELRFSEDRGLPFSSFTSSAALRGAFGL